jgi:hypothetical protein
MELTYSKSENSSKPSKGTADSLRIPARQVLTDEPAVFIQRLHPYVLPIFWKFTLWELQKMRKRVWVTSTPENEIKIPTAIGSGEL